MFICFVQVIYHEYVVRIPGKMSPDPEYSTRVSKIRKIEIR
jgi:hypothetical protein